MKLSLNRIFQILGGLAFVLSCLVAFSCWQMQRHGEESDQASVRRYQSYLLADELRQSSDDLTRLARTYVVSGDVKWEKQYFEVLDIRNGKVPHPKHYERIYWDFRAADTDPGKPGGEAVPLVQSMKDAGFTESELAKLTEAKANSDDLVRTETIAMNMVKGQYDDGHGGFSKKAEPDLAKAQAMMHDLAYHQYKAKIMKPVEAFLQMLDQRTNDEVAAARHGVAVWSTITLCAIALLSGTILVALVWAYRLVNGVLDEVSESIEAVATGDLMERGHIGTASEDAAGKALRAVHSMRHNLSKIIGQIRSSADSIATGSAEIATGNANLSQRTEHQASSLEETAASMEEMNATVKNSAETAQQATQLATSASSAAQRGGEVVSRVVVTMNEITTSSKKIADIIGVIDGIAFQTNILALNAAVEAARAGEQGRGFAVVASEVRSLAQRSADAAKEIKTLIGTSVDKVEVGAKLVGEAGSAMDDIVAQVKHVAELISDISSATVEQTMGIGQVSSAVSQLDQVTQQNAALVQQSAAAADSLKQQAARMAEAVSVFKLERQHDAEKR